MFKRKLMTLAGIALAVAVLSPAASANAEGTDRPFMGTVSGTVSLNVLTGAMTAHAEGVATHLGEYTAGLEGTATITPTGVFGSGLHLVDAGRAWRGPHHHDRHDRHRRHRAVLGRERNGDNGRRGEPDLLQWSDPGQQIRGHRIGADQLLAGSSRREGALTMRAPLL